MRYALPAALVALAVVPTADATPWTRVSGPTRAGTQVALFRDAGTLHVVSAQGAPATITDTQLGKNGSAVGSTTIATGFDGTGGLALVRTPDGALRLLAAGAAGSRSGGINSFVKPFGSADWSLDPNVYGGADANAADEVAAAVAGNGWVFSTWRGAVVHVGFLPSDGDRSYQPDCCGADPQLATDFGSGAVVLAWITNGHTEGTFVRQIWPNDGAVFALPSGTTAGSFGLASRFGDGTYVAYTDRTSHKVQLYRYAGGIQTLATGDFQVAKVFRALGGRVWAIWGSGDGGVWATRSNMSVTRFEPVQHLNLPSGTAGFYNAEGEGSAGPLDLFADLLVGRTDRGFWRTHVLPVGTVTVHTSYSSIEGGNAHGHRTNANVVLAFTDAGDPLPYATAVVNWYGRVWHVNADKYGHAELHVIDVSGNTFKHPIFVTSSTPGYSILSSPRGG